jgi:hypothetical protein
MLFILWMFFYVFSKFWSDYYGSLDNKREGYNNPTLEKFCDGLKACLNQVVFNAVWCLFDIGILYSYFKYGQKYFPDFLSRKIFIIWSVLVLITSYIIQYFFVVEFGLVKGGSYSAFLQNLAMSLLFIGMYVQRRGDEGQSLNIAINKFIGTLAPTILVGVVGLEAFGAPNLFILVLGSLIAFFDLVYIFILIKRILAREDLVAAKHTANPN